MDVGLVENGMAPKPASGTDVRRTQKQATSNASTAAVDTLASQDTTDIGGATRILMEFVCDQDAYICFGDSSVAAATSDDWPLFAKIPKKFVLDRTTRFFRVIRASADGTLKWRGAR